MRDFDESLLKVCQVSVPDVVLRLFVSTSAILNAPVGLVSLQKSVIVNCLPCVAGWTRKELTNSGDNQKTWTCQMCGRSQYIVDPNKHRCQVWYHSLVMSDQMVSIHKHIVHATV